MKEEYGFCERCGGEMPSTKVFCADVFAFDITWWANGETVCDFCHKRAMLKAKEFFISSTHSLYRKGVLPLGYSSEYSSNPLVFNTTNLYELNRKKSNL